MLLVPEKPIVAAFIEELIEAATAAELPDARGIMVFGSKGSWLVAAPAAEGESAPAIPPRTDEAADALGVAPPVGVVAMGPLRVWLIVINCSNWLSEIIWPTIAVGS